MLNKPLRAAFNTDGLLYYPWVVAAALALVFLLIGYAKFLVHLPSKTRWYFVTSGIIFVTGAIVAESISSYYETIHGMASYSYRIPMTIEEFLEMLGIAIFIFAIMTYYNEHLIGGDDRTKIDHAEPSVT